VIEVVLVYFVRKPLDAAPLVVHPLLLELPQAEQPINVPYTPEFEHFGLQRDYIREELADDNGN
jgi:hypothetical protein